MGLTPGVDLVVTEELVALDARLKPSRLRLRDVRGRDADLSAEVVLPLRSISTLRFVPSDLLALGEEVEGASVINSWLTFSLRPVFS